MKLIRPKFWQYLSWQSIILLPLTFIYWLIINIRYLLAKPKSIGLPVICIGNITVGGGGKTPIALTIGQYLLAQNKKIAFLTRGYGGSLSSNRSSLQVLPALHSSQQVGDEALLLAEIAPTYIGSNRYLSAEMAKHNGAEIIIMDDGMQNYSLSKTFTIIAADSDYGLGNNLLLPSGPLRQTLASAEKQADYIIYTGSKQNFFTSSLPSIIAENEITNLSQLLALDKCIVVLGVANPQKVLNTLQNYGVKIHDSIIFPDHHQYQDHELEKMIKLSVNNKATLITTNKDYVKLSKNYKNQFVTINFNINISNIKNMLHNI